MSKNIVTQIIEQKGDYALGLKRNHAKLYKAVEELILQEGEGDSNRLYDAFDNSHGRSVRRRYFGYDVSKLDQISEWSAAKTVVVVETILSKSNDINHYFFCRMALLFIKLQMYRQEIASLYS